MHGDRRQKHAITFLDACHLIENSSFAFTVVEWPSSCVCVRAFVCASVCGRFDKHSMCSLQTYFLTLPNKRKGTCSLRLAQFLETTGSNYFDIEYDRIVHAFVRNRRARRISYCVA